MILALLVAFVVWRWRPRLARWLVGLTMLALWATSTSVVVDPLYRWWQNVPPADVSAVKQTQAIVVLGGGRIGNAREWHYQDQVNRHALIRLRYGAYLARQTALPVALAGGAWPLDRVPESELMRVVMAEYGVPVRWTESTSLTTWDNAYNLAELLHVQGVLNITLVTQAFHMRRAQTVFENAGFQVLPAPTDYAEQYITTGSGVLNWVPSGSAANRMRRIINEMLGMLVYWVKGKLGSFS